MAPPAASPSSPPAPANRKPVAGWAREFWRGLTTADFRVLLAALGVVGVALVAAIALAREDRVIRGTTEAWVDDVGESFARASALAQQGAARHAAGDTPLVLFVGPSALRCWLPEPAAASRVAGEVVGAARRVMTMCGDMQGYATTAALIERFGTDFNGWIVIGVNRQMIAREFVGEDLERRQNQTCQLGFSSPLLRSEAEFLGYPQAPLWGCAFWDHRRFYLHNRLGLSPWLPSPLTSGHELYFVARGPIALERVRAGLAPFSPDKLERHLTVLGRIVAAARRTGRARVAFVETPWLDRFEGTLQTPAWHEEEAAYTARRTAWAREQGVPWLTGAERFPATLADFADGRHIGSPALRRKFLQDVVRELHLANQP